jgi:flagellar motor protein MotB
MMKIKSTSYVVALMAAVLLAASCASTTKRVKKSASGESPSSASGQTEEQAPAGADEAVDQKAVLGTDGTVAESVPRVSTETKPAASGAAANTSEQKKTVDKDTDAAKAAPEKKETAEEKKARLAAEKEAAKKKKDDYTGWVYEPQKNFTLTNGDIKIDMRGSTGSFNMYAIPEIGNPIPLLATYDEFCSTFFSVMIGRKEYRLNREAGVKSEARKTQYGAQLAYTIPSKAEFVVDFSFMPSIATSTRVDMVRVTVYVINLGKSTQSFTVKGVFDTTLGENTLAHFSTAAHSRVNSEIQYGDMSVEKWIRSSNEKAAVQFLLYGKGITSPKAVTLANRDVLASSTWLPVVHEARSFSSMLSYNNSAMAVNWKTAYLDPLKTDVITFYVSVATDGNDPAGKEFLAALAAGKTALPSNLPNTVATTNVAPQPQVVPQEATESTYYEGMPPISGESTVSNSKASVLDTESPAETGSQSSYQQYVTPVTAPAARPAATTTAQPAATVKNEITDAQLDPEYIQNLLDRIAKLESDPALVDKAEVKQLNDELDAILAKLRSVQ